MIWTTYGRWSDDGLTVLNNYGNVCYELPHSFNKPSVLGRAVVVGVNSLERPTQHRLAVPVTEQA